MRYAVIAILAALAAVAAGAQASSGSSGSDRPSTPPISRLASGKVVQVQSKSLAAPRHENFFRLRTTRTHNSGGAGHDDIANAALAPVENSICRFPNYCSTNDDNLGATMESGEPDNCPEPSGPAFDSTVWYVFQVHHAGLLDLIVDNTTPDGGTPFLASIELFNTSSGSGFCGVASDVTTNFGDTFEAGPGTTLGSTVVIGIGARLSGSAGGNFRLNLRWDPDTDADGLLDSEDSCDGSRGVQSKGGCPDADNDGVVDFTDARGTVDQCRTRFGQARYNGCPDTDGDGKSDHWDNGRVFDFCELKNPARLGRADVNDNGCPDWTELPNLSISPEGVVSRRNIVIGVRWKRFRFSGHLPRGTKVRVSCKPRSHCKKRLPAGSALSKSVKRQLRKVKFVKFHTTIIVKETKRGYIGKVFKIKVSFRRTGGGGRNLNVPPPRKKCIPATGGKSRKCRKSLRTLLDTLQ